LVDRTEGGLVNWTAPLLVLIAVWLVLMTIAGDLPGRILSWAAPS
jgi:hypothetical protein